ncbi:ParB/RepB/Spo0J family partition protein [Parachitinimonas caeni]|uniref:ParB/RepB/Spo0J family partition protein n=1 Tax=Parachitinimonas caeni TaxID=3031301 RepID=A0ABT7DR33_9NEIS|nr:ParB/RepB/Spo0J family partition protein [Parachitinimonas caeni]MDK2122542.1 ParB/RepB/Spo0J family partition protein [Parachitinimonas caeni]
MTKLKGLGRGLDALLASSITSDESLQYISVKYLQPGKYQPRSKMNEEALADLTESIKSQGLIQPILAREIGVDRYEIIAGERRWRAAQRAGLSEVPTVVRKVADEAALAMALIENIQREDLNPIEEAMGLHRLIEEFEMTHEACARAVGRSRSAVTNLLRLLNLTEPVRDLLLEGKLDMGHARALLGLPVLKQIELASKVAELGLSVREVERLVQALTLQPVPLEAKPVKQQDPDLLRLETDLSDRLGAKVAIAKGRKGNGRLTIEYASLDQLDHLLALLQQ